MDRLHQLLGGGLQLLSAIQGDSYIYHSVCECLKYIYFTFTLSVCHLFVPCSVFLNLMVHALIKDLEQCITTLGWYYDQVK